MWLGHSSLKSTEIYLRADPTENLTSSKKHCHRTFVEAHFQSKTSSSLGYPVGNYQE